MVIVADADFIDNVLVPKGEMHEPFIFYNGNCDKYCVIGVHE